MNIGPKEYADLDRREASSYTRQMVELIRKMKRVAYRCEHAGCRAKATRFGGEPGDIRALCALHGTNDALDRQVKSQLEQRERMRRR